MDEKKLNQRLYLDVRYARDRSLSYPRGADIFNLKKNYKNYDSAYYAENFKAYHKKWTCHINMDLKDFNEAVSKLAG